MTTQSVIYRYPSNLELIFPEGLEEISFITEIDGFNYLFVKNVENSQIILPEEFEISQLPQDFLQKLKKGKYQEIEDFRKELQFKNILYQDDWFSASQMARQNILGAISVLINSTLGTKYYWKDIDEASYQFSLDDFNELLKLITERDTKLYFIEAGVKIETETALKSQLASSIDIKSLWQQHEENYQAA